MAIDLLSITFAWVSLAYGVGTCPGSIGASLHYAPISTWTGSYPICSCSVSKGDVKKMAGYAHFLMIGTLVAC